MSSFDQRVAEWLNTATISTSKKQNVLERMSVSISNYRALEIDPAHNPPPSQAPRATPSATPAPTPRPGATPRLGPTPRSVAPTPRLSSSRKPAPSATPRTARSVSAQTATKSEVSPKRAAPPTSVHINYDMQQRIAKAIRRLQEGDDGTATTPLFAPLAVEEVDGEPFANGGDHNGNGNGDIFPHGGPDNQDALGQFQVGFAFGSGADDAPGVPQPDEEDDTMDMVMSEIEDARRRTTLKRKSRGAISAETIDPEQARAFKAESVPKDEGYVQTLVAALEAHHLFSHLDDGDLRYVADIMKIEEFSAGDHIVAKFDPSDDFWVIVNGSATITETTSANEFEEYNNMNVQAGGDGRRASTVLPSGGGSYSGAALPTGSTFGDIHLLYQSISPETVNAGPSGAVCCRIDRHTYKLICTRASEDKRDRYEGFLAKVNFLKALQKEERLRLADALKEAKYAKGDRIIKYGEDGKWFNIILEGQVDVIGRNDAGAEVFVCSFVKGDCVGELEFLFGHRTVADCVAATPVRTAKMTRNHFEKVIGPAKEVLERQAGTSDVYAYYRQTQQK